MYSLCITNYRRYDLLLESFAKVLADPRISEIVISDDCSEKKCYDKVARYCSGERKIKLFRNEENVGMGMNKKLAIERATGEWCILLDSDNVIDGTYLDALDRTTAFPEVIRAPVSGGNGLDYTRFRNWYVSRNNIRHFLSFPKSEMVLNTCNYCVHRERYLQVYEHNDKMIASDTIWFNYLWLKSGGGFTIVGGLQYFHRVHKGSGFMEKLEYNTRMCAETLELIKNL